jgi:hypothetical protein
LKTDGTLNVAGNVITIGGQDITYTWQPTLGGYRLQTGELVTSTLFSSAIGYFNFTFGGAPTNQVLVGYNGSAYSAGFWLGNDTNLYRFSANTLKTDGELATGGAFYVGLGQSYQTKITAVGGQSGIQFGNALDTNLYRSAASLLQTDGDIEVRGGSAYRARLGYIAQTGTGGLLLGSTYDTYLYRYAAGVLKTDGAIQSSSLVVTDWNTATADGWYGSTPGAANAPNGSAYFVGSASVSTLGVSYVRQVAYELNTDNAWMRRCDGGAWQAWTRVVGVPAGGTTDQVLAKASATDYALKWATPAAGSGSSELNYAQITTDTSIAVTTEATAVTLITSGSVTYDGVTPVLIEFFAPAWDNANNLRTITLVLYDVTAGAVVSQFGLVRETASTLPVGSVVARHRLTPVAGARQLPVGVTVATPSQGGRAAQATCSPAYLRVPVSDEEDT